MRVRVRVRVRVRIECHGHVVLLTPSPTLLFTQHELSPFLVGAKKPPGQLNARAGLSPQDLTLESVGTDPSMSLGNTYECWPVRWLSLRRDNGPPMSLRRDKAPWNWMTAVSISISNLTVRFIWITPDP